LSAVRRPSPKALVVDLTRRLAEEFDAVPLPTVTRAVRGAAQAVTLFGEDIRDAMDTVEQIAREDLLAIRDIARERAALATSS
jgi:hypothetical protein